MKLDKLLKQYPWEETRRQLCALPSSPREETVQSAGDLIEGQRETQVSHLVELMRTPRLEPRHAEENVPPAKPSPKAGTEAFQLSDPGRTARLVLSTATRVGKDLRLFSVADLDRLGPSTRALGRLLQLLAEAESLPRRERRTLQRNWDDLRNVPSDFGTVLTPMVSAAFGSAKADEDAELLLEAVRNEMDWPRKQLFSSSDEDLARWVHGVCRAGGRRLTHLRSGEHL